MCAAKGLSEPTNNFPTFLPGRVSSHLRRTLIINHKTNTNSYQSQQIINCSVNAFIMLRIMGEHLPIV
jgi:hypothetical protein